MELNIEELNIEELNFDKGDGFVTVVTTDADTGQVLMVARADRDAMHKTIATGEMHYSSRSRGLWHKGETSGNTQTVVSLAPDCDSDAVLAQVTTAGPACHRNEVSCFDVANGTLSQLAAVISHRIDDPDESSSYTARLALNRNLRLKKIGEEAAELIAALADDDRSAICSEAADVMYHVLVACAASGVDLKDISHELRSRQ